MTDAVDDVTYLARDYESLRARLLDRLAVTLPDWSSRYAPDVGVTLIELVAYLGDRLAYRQDAVATEAYVATARRRISVQRHARLVDERMHDGCAARALVHVAFDERNGHSPPHDAEGRLLPATLDTLAFLGGVDVASSGPALRAIPARAEAVFTRVPGVETPLAFGPMELVTRLEGGATSAVIRVAEGRAPSSGTILVFRNEAERLAHTVRVSSVDRLDDGVRLSWRWADRVPHPIPADGTSVHGNVLCLEHGRPEREPLRDDRRLRLAPLTFTVPAREDVSVAALMRPNPRNAVPSIQLREAESGVLWEWRRDLVSSSADDRHFTIEIDDEGHAYVRFGDGTCGRDPGRARLDVDYRVGNGPGGNVRRGTIRTVVALGGQLPRDLEYLTVEQRLSAQGGTSAEDVAALRSRLAIGVRRDLVRAVVADDYARIAESHPRVQRAAAQMSWCGSCQIVRVAIDPYGENDLPAELRFELQEMLERARRVGHEVRVEPARYIDIGIWLDVVVHAAHSRVGVGNAIHGKVSALFHPDRFSFGQPLYQSQIVQAVRALGGVESIDAIDVTKLKEGSGLDEMGVVRIGPLEIARFEHRSVPSSTLHVRMRGGR